MKKFLAHPLVILALTLFAVLFVISLQKTAQKSQVASENVRLLEEKTQQLSDQIEQEKQALENSSSGLSKEKILRDELLLQKPGEYIIQIPDDKILEANVAEAQKTPWEEWQELLF